MQSVGDKIYDSDNDSVDNYNDDDDNIMALGGSQSNSDILNTVVNDNRGPAHICFHMMKIIFI